MSRLSWNASGERFYDHGVDRGVLYVDGQGVAWSGLISVAEQTKGGEARPFYLDGVKYLNLASATEFEATLEAFGSPKEFAACDGVQAIQNGLFATQQPRKAFSLSYRTLIGNDTDGPTHGYKIHLVYNALAGPSGRNHQTQSADAEADPYSWPITTLPPSLTGRKPTAHFVIDSRHTPAGLLKAIEDILYGSDEAAARIPLVSELVTMFKSEGPVVRRNASLNPAFRLTNGTVLVRKNLAFNPSARLHTGLGVVRRNLALNPRLGHEGGLNSPLANNSYWTISPYLGGMGGIGNTGIQTACKIELNDRANAEAVASVYSLDGLGNSQSSRGIGCWVFSPKDGNANVYVDGTAGSAKATPVGAYQWTWVTTGSPGVGHSGLSFWVNGGAVNGDFIYLTGVTSEPDQVPETFFDGMSPDDEFDYQWEGTPHASSSIARALLVNGGQAATPTYQVTVNGKTWQKVYHSFYHYSPGAPTTVGKYYACQLRIGGQPGAQWAVDTSDYVVGSITEYKYGIFDETGETVVRLKSTVPTAGNAAYVGFSSGNGSRTNQTRLTEVLWEEVSGPGQYVSGPYFDGATPDTDLNYTWDGVPDATPSVALGNAVITAAPILHYSPTPGVVGWTTGNGSYKILFKRALDGDIIAYQSAGQPAMSPGQYFAGRFRVRMAQGSADARISPTIGAYGGWAFHGYVASLLGVPLVVPASGEWVDVSVPSVEAGPPPTEWAHWLMYAAGIPEGTILEFREFISELVPTLGAEAGSFFEGSMPDEGGYFYGWEGVPDESPSTLNTWHLN